MELEAGGLQHPPLAQPIPSLGPGRDRQLLAEAGLELGSPAPIVPGLPDKGLSKCLEKIRCPVDKQQAPAVSAGSLPAVINGEVFKVGSADATERAGADAVIGSGEGI